MKNRYPMIWGALLVCAFLISNNRVFAQGTASATIKKFTTSPEIDGIANDPEWGLVDAINATTIIGDPLHSETSVKIAWADNSRIYVLVEREDSDLLPFSPDNAVFKGDYIALHFALGGRFPEGYDSTQFWLRFDMDAATDKKNQDGRFNGWSPEFKADGIYNAAVAHNGDIQTLEMMLDLPMLFEANGISYDPSLAADSIVGFEIEDGDAVNNTYERIGQYTWNDVDGNAWKSPAVFGSLTLSSEEIVPTINSVDKKLSNTAYPNPTTGLISFDDKSIKKVEIFNMTGRMMRSFQNIRNGQVDLGFLKPSLYTLRLINAANELETIRISKR